MCRFECGEFSEGGSYLSLQWCNPVAPPSGLSQQLSFDRATGLVYVSFTEKCRCLVYERLVNFGNAQLSCAKWLLPWAHWLQVNKPSNTASQAKFRMVTKTILTAYCPRSIVVDQQYVWQRTGKRINPTPPPKFEKFEFFKVKFLEGKRCPSFVFLATFRSAVP